VRDHTITDACTSPPLREHAKLLSVDGLSLSCRSCPEVQVCGGGAVPHRYGGDGFDHPSVYCNELLAIIRHVRRRLTDAVTEARPIAEARRTGVGIDLPAFEFADSAAAQVGLIMRSWRDDAQAALISALHTYAGRDPADEAAAELLDASADRISQVATTPSAVLWTRLSAADASGRPLRALNGDYLRSDAVGPAALEWLLRNCDAPRPFIHRDDELLRLPFGGPIVFLPYDGTSAASGRAAVSSALTLIGDYSGTLLAELRALCSDIQLIQDRAAHPDKAVSFSDDSVPGALYVAPVTGQGQLSVIDLADSIIHEHRHQKLYLLSRVVDLVATDRPLVHSPWREEPRPPSGVLHAVFVFTELRQFWKWVHESGPAPLRERAQREIARITRQLSEGFGVLQGTALTPAGERLVSALANRTQLQA